MHGNLQGEKALIQNVKLLILLNLLPYKIFHEKKGGSNSVPLAHHNSIRFVAFNLRRRLPVKLLCAVLRQRLLPLLKLRRHAVVAHGPIGFGAGGRREIRRGFLDVAPMLVVALLVKPMQAGAFDHAQFCAGKCVRPHAFVVRQAVDVDGPSKWRRPCARARRCFVPSRPASGHRLL